MTVSLPVSLKFHALVLKWVKSTDFIEDRPERILKRAFPNKNGSTAAEPSKNICFVWIIAYHFTVCKDFLRITTPLQKREGDVAG